MLRQRIFYFPNWIDILTDEKQINVILSTWTIFSNINYSFLCKAINYLRFFSVYYYISIQNPIFNKYQLNPLNLKKMVTLHRLLLPSRLKFHEILPRTSYILNLFSNCALNIHTCVEVPLGVFFLSTIKATFSSNFLLVLLIFVLNPCQLEVYITSKFTLSVPAC